MPPTRFVFLVAFACAAPGVSAAETGATAPAVTATPAAEVTSIAATLSADAEFSTFMQLLKASGLEDMLKTDGPYTVFAPTNAAFAAEPPGSMEAWLAPENKAKLERLMNSHIVAGIVRSQDIPAGTTKVPTLSGTTVLVVKTGNAISVGGAKMAGADRQAANGYIHAIDRLAMPEAQTN